MGLSLVVVCGLLTAVASLVVKHRLSSCGTRAHLLCDVWDLPRPEIEPLSPALAGGFYTAEPLGKPRSLLFYVTLLRGGRGRGRLFCLLPGFFVFVFSSFTLYRAAEFSQWLFELLVFLFSLSFWNKSSNHFSRSKIMKIVKDQWLPGVGGKEGGMDR